MINGYTVITLKDKLYFQDIAKRKHHTELHYFTIQMTQLIMVILQVQVICFKGILKEKQMAGVYNLEMPI